MINQERWFKFSYCEQMGHIGSEITRARIWEDKGDLISRDKCLERALELIDVTKDDSRLLKRRKELCILRELVADKYIHETTYNVSLTELDQYCEEFALINRKDK